MSTAGTSFEPRVTLRPRSQDETFDLTLAYLRAYARDYRGPIIMAVLISLLPALLVQLLLSPSGGVVAGVAIVTTGLSERSLTAFAGRHVFGNPATIKGAWRATLVRLPFGLASVLFLTLPVILVLGADFEEAALGLGVMMAFLWPLMIASHLHVAEVMHLEQLRLSKATQRARALVSFRYGRALGLVVTGVVVRLLFVLGTYSAGTFIFAVVLQFKGVADNFGVAFALLGYALSGPYLALVRFFDYIDARTRREGWDIQVRFNAIAQRDRQSRESRLAA